MDYMTNGGGYYQQSGVPRSRGRKRRRNGWMKEARDAFCFGFLAICFATGAILFGTVDSRVDAVCNDIEDIDRGEQRVCRPPKTQDVKIVNFWENLTAYRYGIDDLPGTFMRTTHWDYNETVWDDEHKRFRFELSAGGTVNFTSQGHRGMVFDLFLMTRRQYKDFVSKGKTDSVWSNKTTAYSSMMFTAETADLYYIVSSASYGTLGVNQRVTVTSTVHNVSKTTAKEVCVIDCIFRNVRHDEVVILDYTGSSKNRVTFVYSGKGGFRDLRLVLILIMSFCSLIFGIPAFLHGRKANQLYKKSREQDDAASTDKSLIPNCPPIISSTNKTVLEVQNSAPRTYSIPYTTNNGVGTALPPTYIP